MEQELVRSIVEEYYKLDLSVKSRKTTYVEARAMYYKLCRVHFPQLSLDRIGKEVDRDHAVTINGIKRLEGWLTYEDRIQKIYAELNEKVCEVSYKSKGYVRFEDTEELYESKYRKLLDDYNELARKFLFLRASLAKYETNRVNSDVFELKEEKYAKKKA